jgi:cytidylate kinase
VGRSVICISQTTASGGQEIGRAVAERLGFRHVDEEIVERAAELEGTDAEEIADVERRQTWARRLLSSLDRRAKLETYGRSSWFRDPDAPRLGALPLTTSEDLREGIRSAIHETAEQGDVVIVSHGASFALADTPGLLRVLVVASPETRARRIAAKEPDPGRALRKIHRTDQSRADYLKRFYGVAREEPTHYDIVVNTDVIDYDEATNLIVLAAGRDVVE